MVQAPEAKPNEAAGRAISAGAAAIAKVDDGGFPNRRSSGMSSGSGIL